MALKSWSILSFPEANFANKVTQTRDMFSATTDILTFSVLISNYSDTYDANVIIERRSSLDVVKFKWHLFLPVGNSPVALDNMTVFTGGDKLTITSNLTEVSVDVNGDQV